MEQRIEANVNAFGWLSLANCPQILKMYFSRQYCRIYDRRDRRMISNRTATRSLRSVANSGCVLHHLVFLRWSNISLATVVGIICSSAALAEEQVPILNRWTIEDPLLVVPRPVRILPESWQVLWEKALTGPEEDLRRQAAEAILGEFKRGNVDVFKLKDALLLGYQTARIPTVRLSLAATLIAMDVPEAAPHLHRLTDGRSQRAIRRVEPALARWRYEPMIAVWRNRLDESHSSSDAELVSAIQGLEVCEDTDAVPGLVKLALDPHAQSSTRLRAADGIAKLQTHGLEDTCREYLNGDPGSKLLDRQVAIRMLRGHESPAAIQLMLLASTDAHSSVSVVALQRLLEIAPEALNSSLVGLLQNADPVIRRLAVKAVSLKPSSGSVRRLAQLLGDPHPDVRNDARISLESFAVEENLADLVTREVRVQLLGESWRGIEQATRLLGSLDDEMVADDFVRLLRHERGEVRVTAAWALREVAVEKTLGPMLEFSQQLSVVLPASESSGRNGTQIRLEDACLGHLFEAFGKAEYLPAKALLLQYVSKRSEKGESSRSAAVWALGLMHATDSKDESIVAALLDRATDTTTRPEEYEEVRTAAAVSLARMQAIQTVDALNQALGERAPARTIEGIKWAIGQLTGTPLPATKPRYLAPTQPFLRAID